jgi:hypothetical protein
MRMSAKQRTCRAGTDDAQHARLHAHGSLGVFRGGGWSDDGEEQQRAEQRHQRGDVHATQQSHYYRLAAHVLFDGEPVAALGLVGIDRGRMPDHSIGAAAQSRDFDDELFGCSAVLSAAWSSP